MEEEPPGTPNEDFVPLDSFSSMTSSFPEAGESSMDSGVRQDWISVPAPLFTRYVIWASCLTFYKPLFLSVNFNFLICAWLRLLWRLR